MATDFFNLHSRAHGVLRRPDTFFNSRSSNLHVEIRINNDTKLKVTMFVADETRHRKVRKTGLLTIAIATAYLAAIKWLPRSMLSTDPYGKVSLVTSR